MGRAVGTAASRSAAAPRPSRCWPSRSGRSRLPRCGAGPSASSTSSRRSRVTHSDEPGACGSQPTRRSGTSSATSTTRSATPDSPQSGARICPRSSRAATRRRSSIRRTASSSRRGSCAGSRGARPTAGVEIHEHTHVGSLEQTGAETVVVATDGYPSGLLGALEGLVIPTRGQVIATEPIDGDAVRDPALRQARLRLLAPASGRPHRRGRLPRRLARHGVHGGRGSDAARPAGARALRRDARRPAATHRLPLGRDLRDGLRLPPGRRARAGRGRTVDRGRLLGARQRPRVRLRPSRRPGDPRRERPAARALRAGAPARRRVRPDRSGSSRASELELLQVELACLGVRRLRDREILDRESRRVEERDVARAAAPFGLLRRERPRAR